jgi:hypothetical protein
MTRVRILSRALPFLLLCGAVPPARAAQQVAVPPPRQQTPARDVTPATQKGTAVIRGRVVAADTGRPLRRARVTLSAPDLGPEGRRATSTNPDGVYEIKELRAARYRVSVTRGGYLPLDYGQRRPGEQGRPVEVGDGEVVEKIDFALPRTASIAGRVTDETGDPIKGVSVYVMRMLFFEGSRRLVPVVSSSITTDDLGEFRINRVPPGSYAVMASTKETWTVTQNGVETVYGYMPTYFPGVGRGTEARRINLTVGQQVGGIDFSLIPGRTAKVSGVAIDSQGRPFTRVSLSDEVRGMNFASFRGGPEVTVSPDGGFAAHSVPPGQYRLVASRMSNDPLGPEVAMMTLDVEGADLENLMLTGSSGGTVSGRVVVEGDAAPPKWSAVNIYLAEPLRNQPAPALLGAFKDFGQGVVQEDGSFTVPHVFGKARFRVNVPEGWMVKSITQDGKDITDAPLELRSGDAIAGIEVLLTNRVTRISGALMDERSRPVRDATVLLFPEDADRWYETARTIRAARPDQQGRWEAKGLPAGDYLAIALDYVEDGAWNDPEFLESLRRDARKVTLADGGSETVLLKVIVPKQ